MLLRDNFNGLRFAIIGIFAAAWVGSVAVYRYMGLDSLEGTTSLAAMEPEAMERRLCETRRRLVATLNCPNFLFPIKSFAARADKTQSPTT